MNLGLKAFRNYYRLYQTIAHVDFRTTNMGVGDTYDISKHPNSNEVNAWELLYNIQ